MIPAIEKTLQQKFGAGIAFQPHTFLDFNQPSTLPLAKFDQETMHGGDHRKGNRGMDRNGNLGPDLRVDGKRDSAWYDGDLTKVAFYGEGEGLILKPNLIKANDPTRRQYTDHRGKVINWQDNRFELPFIVSKSTIYGGDDVGHIDNPDHPGLVVGPGQYREWNINMSNKCMPGVRTSLWEMGWRFRNGVWVRSKAYNKSYQDGFEIDLLEAEPQSRFIMQKVVAGDLGDTDTRLPWIESNGMVEVKKLFGVDFNIFEGDHTFGLYHDINMLLFTVDGTITNWDYRSPECDNYILATMEANGLIHSESVPGKKTGPNPPYLPHDSGLFGRNAYDSLDKWESEKTIIRSFGVWDVPELPDDVMKWCLSRDTGDTATLMKKVYVDGPPAAVEPPPITRLTPSLTTCVTCGALPEHQQPVFP